METSSGLQKVIIICKCLHSVEFSQELYRGVLREDDSANKTVARIIFSGEDSIHLAGVRSDHFQMEELGDGSREVRSVEALEAMEYLITLIALPTLQFAYVQVKVKAVSKGVEHL